MKIHTCLEDTIVHSSKSPSLLIISDSHIGSLLATDTGSARSHLITTKSVVALQAPDSVQTTVGDVTTAETLRAGADATAAVIALQRDRQSLLVAQLLRTRFGINELLILVNDPRRREAFEGIASSVICASDCLSAELGDAVEQQLLTVQPQS